MEFNKCTNANVFLDGESQIGRCDEVALPELPWMMAEHKALGMFGKTEFFSGMDKMEATFKWSSFYDSIFRKTSNPTAAVAVQVRSNVETHNADGRAEQLPLVYYLRGKFKKPGMGTFKPSDNAEFPSAMAVDYVKVEYDGDTILEIDVLNNICIVDGVDLLEEYRANLGI